MFAAGKVPASRQDYARRQRTRFAGAYAVLADPAQRAAYDRRLGLVPDGRRRGGRAGRAAECDRAGRRERLARRAGPRRSGRFRALPVWRRRESEQGTVEALDAAQPPAAPAGLPWDMPPGPAQIPWEPAPIPDFLPATTAAGTVAPLVVAPAVEPLIEPVAAWDAPTELPEVVEADAEPGMPWEPADAGEPVGLMDEVAPPPITATAEAPEPAAEDDSRATGGHPCPAAGPGPAAHPAGTRHARRDHAPHRGGARRAGAPVTACGGHSAAPWWRRAAHASGSRSDYRPPGQRGHPGPGRGTHTPHKPPGPARHLCRGLRGPSATARPVAAPRRRRRSTNNRVAYQVMTLVIGAVLVISTLASIVNSAGGITPVTTGTTPSASGFVTLGQAQYAQKNWTQAQQYFQQALASDPTNLDAKLGLAEIAMSTTPQDLNQARTYSIQIIQAAPNSTQAKTAIDILTALSTTPQPISTAGAAGATTPGAAATPGAATTPGGATTPGAAGATTPQAPAAGASTQAAPAASTPAAPAANTPAAPAASTPRP